MVSEDAPNNVGRLVIDQHGRIVETDSVFQRAMGTTTSLIGVDALALTAPADRDRCGALIAQVCRDGMPVSTTKRIIRTDGVHLWLRSHMALIRSDTNEDHGDIRVEIRLAECAPPAGWVEPAGLLSVARLAFASRRARADSFGGDLFNDPAWEMLLAAYISEAEGTIATISRIHAWTGIPLGNASRWIRALSHAGLLEYEDGGNRQLVTTPFRLSSSAHAKFELYLSEIHCNRAKDGELALRSSAD